MSALWVLIIVNKIMIIAVLVLTLLYKVLYTHTYTYTCNYCIILYYYIFHQQNSVLASLYSSKGSVMEVYLYSTNCSSLYIIIIIVSIATSFSTNFLYIKLKRV